MLLRLVTAFAIFILLSSSVNAVECSAIFPGPKTFAANGGVSINGSNSCDGGSCSPVNNFTTPTIPFTSASGSFTETSIVDGVYERTSWGLSKETTVTFTGSGTAVIYINGSATIPKDTWINTGGNAYNVLLIVSGSLSIDKDSIIKAHIYAGGSITVDKDAQITGSISANGALQVDKDGSFFYSSGDADQIDGHGFCGSSTTLEILYDFNDGAGQTVTDSSGKGRHGLLGDSGAVESNDATFACEASGYTMAFDASSNQHLVSPSFQPPADGVVAFWLKVPSLPSSRQNIFGFGDGWEIRWEADDVMYLDINKTGSNTSIRTSSVITSSQVVDNWLHVAVVTSVTNNTWSVYLNGVLDNSGSETLTAQSASVLTVGGSTWRPTSEHLHGNIEDFRIYSGSLSSAEIAALAATPPESCAQIANYRFDECAYNGTNGEVIDQLGNYSANSYGGVDTVELGQIARAADLNLYEHHFETSIPLPSSFSVSTWFKKPTSTSDSRYFILGAMAAGGDLMYLDRNNSWRWGVYSPAGGAINGSYSFSSLDNNWHHLTLVYQNNQTSLYIDAVLVDTINLAPSGTLKYIGTSFDSVNTTGAQGFRAPIDEFMIYQGALSASEITAIYTNQVAGKNYDGSTRAAVICPIDHYQIIHDGQGLTCEAETITIKACTNIFDGTCTLSTDEVTLDVVATGSPAVTNNITFTGSTTTSFAFTSPETVALSIANPSLVPTNTTVCNDNSAGSCNLVFDNTGFKFLVNGNDVDIRTQLSGKPSNTGYNSDTLALQAIKTNDMTGACEAAIVSTVDIDFAAECKNPDTCAGQRVVINGTNIDTHDDSVTPPTYTKVNMDFGSTADNSAEFIFSYPDSGEVQLHARYNIPVDGSPSGVYMQGSSNSFVVRPFGFDITVTDLPYPVATDATGSVFKKAGENFEVTIKAVQWVSGEDTNNDGVPDDYSTLANNALTPNFGNENSLETVVVEHELELPSSGGTLGSLSNNSFVGTSFVAGQLSQNLIWNEVGIISLTAELADNAYIGTNNILGNVPYVGRFIPAYFEQAINVDELNAINDNGTLVADHNGTCISSKWVYSGQQTSNIGSIRYGVEPKLTITAKNTSGDPTKNYVGEFAKLSAKNISLAAPQTSGKALTGVYPLLADDSVGVLSSFTEGQANFTFSDQHHFIYTRNNASKVAPFFANFEIPVEAIEDSDQVSTLYNGIEHKKNPLFSETTPNGSNTINNSLTIKFGRMIINNAYGPETADLPVSMFTQYWNGTQFVINADDSCTTPLVGDKDDTQAIRSGGLSEWQYRLFDTNGIDDAISTADTAASVSGSFSGGKLALPDGLFKFSTPNNQGNLEFEYQVPTWLQYDWVTQDGSFDENPTATLTFGLFRGNDRIIYWREVNN